MSKRGPGFKRGLIGAMMVWRSLLKLCGIGCALATASVPTPALAQSKASVKAAMVYNIMRFTRFPSTERDLRLCTSRQDPLAPHLRALEGRTVGKAKVSVLFYRNYASIGSECDVVYIDRLPASAVGGAHDGQLLIGSGRGFANRGGTVGLIKFGGQIRFVVNDNVAQKSRIGFSAQLMQLAAKVIS